MRGGNFYPDQKPRRIQKEIIMKTLAVFGASGRTGRELVKHAIDRGYAVRALARDPAKIPAASPNLQIIKGDATNAVNVEETIKGADAVISVLGMVKGSAPDLKVVSTGYIVDAMKKHGVKRFLKMASAPFGVPGEGDKPTFGQKLMTGLVKVMMKAPVEDDVKSCEQLTASDVDWTIVRAPMLTSASLGKSEYKIGSLGNSGGKVSRASVAAFILDELEKGQFIQKSPLVSN
jgi:putative NADH-flavin reductase